MRDSRSEFGVVFTLALFFLLLLSCSNTQAISTKPAPIPSVTFAPVKTLIPTKSIISLTPSLSVNESLPEITSSSLTPSPSINESLPGITPSSLTPSLTSTRSTVRHYLKNWSEEDALALIDAIDTYARQINSSENCGYWPRCLSGVFRTYTEAEEMLGLSIREALYRYPNLAIQNELLWQLILTDAITRRPPYPDDALEKLLEEGLNQGHFDPDQLDAGLKPYGFRVTKMLLVNNLFGDGQENFVFLISVDGDSLGTVNRGGLDGFIAALRNDQNGNYDIVKVDSSWQFGHSTGYDVIAEELTGDYQPELIVESFAASGGSHGIGLNVFQWRSDHFRSITPTGEPIRHETDTDLYWQITQAGPLGLPAIQILNIATFPGVVEETYSWDNGILKLIERSVSPGEWTSCSSSYALEKLPNYDVAVQLEMLDTCLSEWPVHDSESLGPSYPDYLRFYLAMLQMSASQDAALATLQAIISDPVNPDNLTVPQAAQAYLDNFNNEWDFYRACQAANSLMSATLGDDFSIANITEKWGYDPPWSMPLQICDLSASIPLLVGFWNSAGLVQVKSIVSLLEQAGVTVQSQEILDLDENGRDDLVAIVPLYRFWRPCYDIWAFTDQQNDLASDKIRTYCGSADDPLPELSIERLQLGGNDLPVHLIRLGNDLLVFQTSQDGLISMLLRTNTVIDYSIIQTDQNTSVSVFYDEAMDDYLDIQVRGVQKYLFSGNGAIFDWDQLKQNFVLSKRLADNPFGENLENVAFHVEEVLFKEKNLLEAIAILEILISEPEPDYYFHYSRPRLYYLLGLAYELAGEEQKALDTYLLLRDKYPESAYNLMIEEKIITE